MASDPRYTDGTGFLSFVITLAAIGFFGVFLWTLFIIYLPMILLIGAVVALIVLFDNSD